MRLREGALVALLVAAPAASQMPHAPGGPLVPPIDLPPPPVAPAAASLPPQEGELPDEATQRAVLAASYAYFAARDGGHVDAAYAMIAPSMRAYLTKPLYAAQIAPFNVEAGAVQQRFVSRISWYRDPPEASAPGLYAAADFVSRFPNLYLHCGYLMWHQEPGGAWKLAREEQSFIDTATAQDMPPEQRNTLPRQMGCVAPDAPE